MDWLARRTGFPPEIGVLAIVGAAALPLGRLFEDAEPGQLNVSTIQLASLFLSLALAWGMRRLHVPLLISAATSAVVFMWFAGIVFAPQTMFGPLPTPSTFAAVADTLRTGLNAVATEAVPVAPTGGFLSLVSAGIWGTTWLADDAAIRLRHPLLAIGLTLPIFAMPGTLTRGSNQWIGVAIYIAAALLLLFQDERFRLARWAGSRGTNGRPGPASRIGLVVIALGILLAPTLPGYSQQPGGNLRQFANGSGARVTVNPLVSVQPSLNETPVASLFTVKSNEPLYWRLTSLDQYNGRTWTASKEGNGLSIGGELKPTQPGPVVRVTQEITIDALAGPWVPAAYEPVRIQGVRGAKIAPDSRTLVLGAFKTGQSFTVVSQVPSPTTDELVADNGADPEGGGFLDLPANTPDQIREIAVQVAGRATTRMERALALQEYLRTFRYDEQVALRHNYSDLVTFLTVVRTGYCEQFSAAMAVMARSIGIPARVAVGFGTGDAGDTPGAYKVTSRQAHAWVEIHFPSYGWVTFDPTPRSDGGFAPPSYARNAQAPDPSASPRASSPSASPSPTASASPARDRGENTPVPSSAGSSASAIPAVMGILVLTSLALFPGVSAIRRVVRRRAARGPREAVGIRYVEFLEWCRTVAAGRGDGETPFEHARRLSARAVQATEPLTSLARAATAAVFAEETSVDAGTVQRLAKEARRYIAPTVPKGRRLLPMLGWGWWRKTPSAAKPTRDRLKV